VLARSGTSVQVDGSPVASGIATVSTTVLGALPIPGSIASEALTRFVDRRLHEDDATDTVDDRGHLVVVNRSDIVLELIRDVVAASTVGECAEQHDVISINAQDPMLGESMERGEAAASPADTQICVHLEWPEMSGGGPRSIRLTGESLSDVKGHACIVSGLATTSVTLVVPMAILVETSIALPDVLSRLLAHPAVMCELPDGEPTTAYTRLLSTSKRTLISLRRGIELRIGAAAGLVDPILLDTELRSGIIVGKHVSSAIADNRLSVARLSRITREFARIETAAETIH
jgi:hypothetical protein